MIILTTLILLWVSNISLLIIATKNWIDRRKQDAVNIEKVLRQCPVKRQFEIVESNLARDERRGVTDKFWNSFEYTRLAYRSELVKLVAVALLIPGYFLAVYLNTWIKGNTRKIFAWLND